MSDDIVARLREAAHYAEACVKYAADLAAARAEAEEGHRALTLAGKTNLALMEACEKYAADLAAAREALGVAHEAIDQLLDDMQDGLCVCQAAKEQAQDALARIDAALAGKDD